MSSSRFSFQPQSGLHLRAGRLLLACLLVGASLFAQATQAGEAARVVFVAGAVQSDGKPLLMDQAVEEGKLIATAADGYVYLKTADGGFLILRPNTQARIVAYHIDKQQPGNSRIKLELLSGVARSISGEGVKNAREHFRFNTPLAAIGVRGTDFTVFADQTTSRVAVVSGGVVVSPFVGGCRPEGGGPCEGDASRELFASQVGQVLQIKQGQSVPQLLRGNSATPDGAAPPRADEPPAKSGDAGSGKSGVALSQAELGVDVSKTAALQKDLLAAAQSVAVTPVSPPPSQIIWGRWQSVLDQAANIDLNKLMDGTTRLVGINTPFALLRQKTADWQMPQSGSMGFVLQQAEAYILNEPTAMLTAAKVQNGKLNVDFAVASFSTSFDLVGQAALYKLQAQGAVTADGQLVGQSQFSRPTNMLVTGVLGAQNSGTAAYLFQSRLNDTNTVTGATYWGGGR